MKIELDPQDILTILESLEYSKQRVRDAEGTPYEVRRENLQRLDEAKRKLKAATE